MKVTTKKEIECHDIQGIVASGYDHLDFVRFVFLEIDNRRSIEAREWLKYVIPKITKAVHPGKDKPSTCFNLALSWQGILGLGIPASLIHDFPHEFVAGMHRQEAASILGDENDSHQREWE